MHSKILNFVFILSLVICFCSCNKEKIDIKNNTAIMTSGNWTLRSEKYETIERGNYGRSHYSTEFDDAVLSNSNTFYIRTYDRFLSLNLTNSGKAVFSNSIKMVDLHALDFNLSVLCYKAGPMQYSHGYIWFPINIDYKRDVFGGPPKPSETSFYYFKEGATQLEERLYTNEVNCRGFVQGNVYFECPYWQYDACAYNFSTRKISDLRYFPFHTNMLHDIYFCGSDTNNLRCVFLVSEDNGSVTCIKAAKVTDDSTWTITSSVELEKGANKKIEYIDEDNSYCYFSITYLPSVSGLKQYFRISYVTGIIEEMVHSYKSTGKFIGIANGKPYFAKYNDTQLESIYYLNNNKWYALPIDGLKKMIPAYMYLKIKPLGRQNKLYFVISATKMLEPYEPLYQVDYYVIEYTESIAK